MLQVIDGDHLLGVTQNGTLAPTQRPPAAVSADDLKLVGFIAAAVLFVLVQYALVSVSPKGKKLKHPAPSSAVAEQDSDSDA